MSKQLDEDFGDRLVKAAMHARIKPGPTELGRFLGFPKQKVANWLGGMLPRADVLFEIADKLNVRTRWLAVGEGTMIRQASKTGLTELEEELVSRWREADPRWQLTLRLLASLATEDQLEVASDVNVVIARILGKRPRDLRYASDKRVESAFGEAPHVAARKLQKIRR